MHHESDAFIYELQVKGFTKSFSSGVDPCRAGTYAGPVEKITYLKELGITIVELMPVFQRDPHEGDYRVTCLGTSSRPMRSTPAALTMMNSILNSETWSRLFIRRVLA